MKPSQLTLKPMSMMLGLCLAAVLCDSAGTPAALADSDISSQFPDRSPGQGMSQNSNSPWVVEQYRGNRRRQKVFNAPAPQNNQFASAGAFGNAFGNTNNGFTPGGFNPGGFNPGGFNRGPNQTPRPDKFADFPDTDASGVRHFANGRHYDLKNISIEQAVATSAASDDQIQQEAMQAKRQRRNRMRNGF